MHIRNLKLVLTVPCFLLLPIFCFSQTKKLSRGSSPETFQLSGQCERKITTANCGLGGEGAKELSEFKVKNSKMQLLTRLNRCSPSEIKVLEQFVHARLKKCSLMIQPGQKISLALVMYNAEVSDNSQSFKKGDVVTSLIVLNEQIKPEKIFEDLISNEESGEGSRSDQIEYICDLDGDKKAEIVALVQRYAGGNYEVLQYADNPRQIRKTEYERGCRD